MRMAKKIPRNIEHNLVNNKVSTYMVFGERGLHHNKYLQYF